MVKEVLIFGANDFGRLMKYYLEKNSDRNIAGFIMNKAYIQVNTYCNLPVFPFESINDLFAPSQYEILLAIGNSKMNDVRKKIFCECKEKGYDIASFIHSSCSINHDNIGEGNIVLENCLIYPFSKIGCGNLLWDHVVISHDCSVGDFNTFSSYADLCGYVTIGNNGYYGKHCIVNEHLVMADYTLVGAAGYVKKNTKPYEVVVPPRSVVVKDIKSTDLM